MKTILSTMTALLLATTATAEDLPADFSTTSVVTIGSNAPGTIETMRDRDGHKVNLQAYRTYAIQGIPGREGYCNKIEIFAPNGTKVAEDVCSDGATRERRAQIEFFSQHTGTHLIVFDDISDYPQDVPYDYWVRADNDCAGSRRTTCKIHANTDVTGVWEIIGDNDWLYASLPRNVYFELTSNVPMEVRKNNGTLVGKTDSTGRLRWRTINSSTQYVRYHFVAKTPEAKGQYRFKVRRLG